MPTRARAKRRRQRGAAMVESAVIAVFMLMVFACLWAALQYQSAKIHTLDEARHAAWVAALKPCEGSGDSIADIGESTGDADSDPLPSTKPADKYLEIGTTSLARDSGYVDVTRKRTVTFPKLMGGGSHEMSSRMVLRCNEPKPPENALDFFKTAFGVVKYTFSF